ncbi:hypothetical protein NADFUDRAFT_82596 [Nadsonia fulvescens var. elongata DSM 6958]|uniref:Uncharacterized protein n=1 Tax=Nadsonia fulvescens var. elongata DSM 6958 TaxID=857566 RepID=A0A1E3PJS6_9ASCO|nr:hypothetical protein NADFUDRAFT_82596 [Nadsonia fulvescens var. elongata DSM 6958]
MTMTGDNTKRGSTSSPSSSSSSSSPYSPLSFLGRLDAGDSVFGDYTSSNMASPASSSSRISSLVARTLLQCKALGYLISHNRFTRQLGKKKVELVYRLKRRMFRKSKRGVTAAGGVGDRQHQKAEIQYHQRPVQHQHGGELFRNGAKTHIKPSLAKKAHDFRERTFDKSELTMKSPSFPGRFWDWLIYRQK